MITRRQWWVIALVTVVVGVVVSSLIKTGPKPSAIGSAPGYNGEDRAVDTRPFELPEGGQSVSTLPSSYFGDTLDPAKPIPTTSTTIPLPSVVDASTITNLCGFEEAVGPIERLPQASPADAEPIMKSLVVAVGRYRDVAPLDLAPDLTQIYGAIQHLRDVLAASGWDPTSKAYSAAVAEVTNSGSLQGPTSRVVAAERAACG